MATNLSSFTDILDDIDEIGDSQPISLSDEADFQQPNLQSNKNVQKNCDPEPMVIEEINNLTNENRPAKYTGQRGEHRSVEEIEEKYQSVFTYPLFNLVQSKVIDDALYSDKSMVVCAPTGSGKTVIFEMAIVQLLKELEEKNYKDDFKIIYMAPVKSLCTERLTEWYSKFTPLGLLCVEVTGDTDVDFPQLKPYRIIITTPEKWDILTRRWRDHRSLVEVIKLFLIDEVHILNDSMRGPVLEAVVSRMKTIESSTQSAHRIEQLQQQYQENSTTGKATEGPPRIRFVAVSATVNNPEDVAAWLDTSDRPAVFYKFGDECRPVKLNRVVEGYPCPEGMSIFKFDIILNYKLWPVIQKYHNGKPTLIFCSTRKSVQLTAETLSKELTITFTPEQKEKLTAVASRIKNRKLQQLILSGVGCHHAGLLYEERLNIEQAFRNRDLPILITTTTLAMGVNLPAHLVIIKNTQLYVNGAYQEYSISTVLQMIGRAGRPQFDTEATAVIMTRLADKPRYQQLVGGSEPLQSFLHKRLAENLNSEVALGTVSDVAQCVQWLRSTFLYVRAAKDPKWYLGLPHNAPHHLILKKIEELCVKAMNGLASAGLITMDEASCIESTEAGRLMSLYYLDLETMKHIMKIKGTETLDQILWIICESHELADMHLRMDERRCLNTLNRNNQAATIRFPMKGKINSREMKLNCMIQAVLGCLPINEPALNQEAMKVMRIADRVCKCLVAYVTRPDLVNEQPKFYSAVLNSIMLAKCIAAHLWENSPYVSKQLKGIGPTFSTLLATAGKVNFLLLEESHPRDLERIMNKSAPAGNIIRKQISLLPKYQITATPIDEKRVSIQVTLLNQSCLAENLENLTAGANHKSYIVIGDSENQLLLLTSFKDKDLISVYDGSITHEITRKLTFEHKILAHCVSFNFVGIDVQCEYIFKSIEQPIYYKVEASTPNVIPSSANKIKKQTCITDVFKERKRKVTEDITQSKEKKKRENALMSKLKLLKESLECASREAKEDTFELGEISQSEIIEGSSSNYQNCSENRNIETSLVDSKILSEYEYPDMIEEDQDVMVDEKIESILSEIESEISKQTSSDRKINTFQNKERHPRSSCFISSDKENKICSVKRPITHSFISNKRKIVQYEKLNRIKSNYNFTEHLEDNTDTPEDVIEDELKNKNTFSNTIKCQIEKFLQQTRETITNKTSYETFIDDTPHEKLPINENNYGSPLIEEINKSKYSVPVNIAEVTENRSIVKQKVNNEICAIIRCEDEVQKITNCDLSHDPNLYEKSTYSVLDKVSANRNMVDQTMNDEINSVTRDENNIPHSTIHDLSHYDNFYAKSIYSMPDNFTRSTENRNSVDQKINHELITINKDKNEVQYNANYELHDDDLYLIPERDNMECNAFPKTVLTYSKHFRHSFTNINNSTDIMKDFFYSSPNVERTNEQNKTHLDKTDDNDLQEFPTIDLTVNSNNTSNINDATVNLRHDPKKYHAPVMTSKFITMPNSSDKNLLLNDNEYDEPNIHEIAMRCDAFDDQTYLNKNEASIKHAPVKLEISSNPSRNTPRDFDTSENKEELLKQEIKHPSATISGVSKNEIIYNNDHQYEFQSEENLNQKGNLHKNQLIKVPSTSTLQCNTISAFPQRNAIVPARNTQTSVLSIAREANYQRITNDRVMKFISNDLKLNNNHTKIYCPITNDCKYRNSDNLHEPAEKALQLTSESPVMINEAQDSRENQSHKRNDYQKKPHINKYSFTATKINVSNKNKPGHNIKIIRKVKLNVDVTEIISQEKNENYPNEDKTMLSEVNLTNAKKFSVEMCKNKNLSILNNKKSTDENKESKTANQHTKIKVEEKSFTDREYTAKKAKTLFCPPFKNIEEEIKLTVTNKEENVESCRQEIESEDKNKMLNRKSSEVENILKKYSKIFQKNSDSAKTENNRSIVAETTKTKDNTKETKPNPFMKNNQTNRIYNIHKLDNSNIGLPKVIVEVSNNSTPTPMPTNAAILSRIKALQPTKYEVKTQPIKYKHHLEDHHTEDTQEEKEEIEYLSPYLPLATQDDPLNEIDQSMFNPKTVLQCFSRESPEFIPPPPEFCDDISYSPTQSEFGSNEHELPINELSRQEIQENVLNFYEADSQMNRSIFENDCERNLLTPSKEIETWILPRDDECKAYFEYSRHPLKSCTVLRKNSPVILTSNDELRNVNLRNFKFTPKNKLRF